MIPNQPSAHPRKPIRRDRQAKAGRAHSILVLLLGLMLPVPSGCDRSTAAADGERDAAGIGNRRLRITCTTGMIRAAAARVAGEHADVTGLMGEGVDPHLYRASPGDVRLLSNADLILYNGLHLEGKMGDLLVKLARRRPVVAMTEDIDRALLREPPEFQGQYDPHVWFDVSLWQLVVTRIRDEIKTLYPAEGAETHEA